MIEHDCNPAARQAIYPVGEEHNLDPPAPQQGAGRDLTCQPYPGATATPAAGMFELFLKQNGPADQFRFGREADGTPAAPWDWEDLDLWLILRPLGPAAPAQHFSQGAYVGGLSKALGPARRNGRLNPNNPRAI
jgi:hypothetical protein